MARRLALLACAAFSLAALVLHSGVRHGTTPEAPLGADETDAVSPVAQRLDPLPARQVAARREGLGVSSDVERTVADVAVDNRTVDILGRVVAAESGAPIPGVAVYK